MTSFTSLRVNPLGGRVGTFRGVRAALIFLRSALFVFFFSGGGSAFMFPFSLIFTFDFLYFRAVRALFLFSLV